MGGAMKYFLKNILDREILRSMVSWTTKFFFEKFIKPPAPTSSPLLVHTQCMLPYVFDFFSFLTTIFIFKGLITLATTTLAITTLTTTKYGSNFYKNSNVILKLVCTSCNIVVSLSTKRNSI